MTEQQKDFVQMYLKHRDKIIAHNIVYGNNSNYDSVESSANRLLRIPEIADTIRSIQDNIRHEVEEEFKAKYREELLTIYDKRRILKKIATGEMYIEQKYKGKNCTQCSQYISPTYQMMMQALKEDSKLAGHYPHKQNGKWIIPALQTEQVQETELSTAGGGSFEEAGGETLAQVENTNPEKDNKGQHPDSYRDETTIDNQPHVESNTDSISLPGACPVPTLESGCEGIEEELPNNSAEKDNNGQHPDSYRDEKQTLESINLFASVGEIGRQTAHRYPVQSP